MGLNVGGNYYGQLGDNTTSDHSVPVPVVNLTGGVKAIVAGGSHTCALLTSNKVQCWGSNGYGQLGTATTTSYMLPVNVVDLSSGIRAIAAAIGHTCAVMESGVKCWGFNPIGQLGDGATSNRTTPVDVVSLNGSVRSIATGGNHTCVSTNIGGVKCWGSNNRGQLGDGTTVHHSIPADVTGINGVTAVASGGAYTCALMNNGSVKCWGNNSNGQLGDRTTTHRSTPVDVVGLDSGVTAVAASTTHTCALMNNGSVKCWGNNSNGQLGNGTLSSHITPVDVIGLSNGVSAIVAGFDYTCGLINGGATCWGENSFGQLGDGTTISRTIPVDVIGLSSGVSEIAARVVHTCALMNRGNLKCWGENSDGQLGDGTAINRTTPVNVVDLSSGVNAITTGGSHTCVLTSSGEVKCWGNNSDGQLGDGNAWRTTPIDVMEMSANTPTPTTTPTPTATNTPAPLATAPPTATPTNTPISTPPSAGNAYEPNDTCAQARTILTDGSIQPHTFQQVADVDWVQFEVTAWVKYLIEGRVPPTSNVDLILEVYGACTGGAEQTQNHTFSPDIRLEFTAPNSGAIHLRLLNNDPAQSGVHLEYHLSVRALSTNPQVGAVIIVAGLYKANDDLQPNIHALTNRAYRLWRAHGYPPEGIRYLATDLNLDADNDGQADVAALSTNANLAAAITQWAVDKVGPDRTLTLYLVDHGAYDKLYLDRPRNEVLQVQELDSWLDQLTAAAPGVSINIIVEACQSGSFIDPVASISGPNRVVVTSTGAHALAWASQQGATFSDALFDALAQGRSLYAAFEEARWAATRRNSDQLSLARRQRRRRAQ